MSEKKQKELEIPHYAMKLVNDQILARSEAHENDKSAYYGYSPIAFLFACMKDGSMLRNLFEFKIVNHFLKDKQPHIALEVVKCLLILWFQNNKQIKDFNLDKINAELKRIDEELEKQRIEQAKAEAEQKAKEHEETDSDRSKLSAI